MRSTLRAAVRLVGGWLRPRAWRRHRPPILRGFEHDPRSLDLDATAAHALKLSQRGLAHLPRLQVTSPDLGTFDVIMFSAVYEHLLPEERRSVLPQIWGALRPGSALCVNQTPHRGGAFRAPQHRAVGDQLPSGTDRSSVRAALFQNVADYQSLDGLADAPARRDRTQNRFRAHWGQQDSRRHSSIEWGTLSGSDYWLAGTSQRLRPVKRCIAFVFRISD